MTPANITDEQRANLTKLAAYLLTLPAEYPDFEMESYVRPRGELDNAIAVKLDTFAHLPECGTAACAAGHGPRAGIDFEPGESWNIYSRRAFAGGDEWSWCFGALWAHVDNTAHGAAARIEWMLANGLPDDAGDQELSDAPLCYVTSPAA